MDRSNKLPSKSENGIKIFVTGGTGRSGSNILRKVIGGHPDVAEIPQEWRFTIDPDGLVDFYETFATMWSPILFDVKFRRLKRLLKKIERYGTSKRMYRILLYRSQIPKIFPINFDLPFGRLSAVDYCPRFKEIVGRFLEKLVRFKYQARWTGSEIFSHNTMHYGGPFLREELARLLEQFFREIVRDVAETQGCGCYVENNTWYPLFFDRFLEIVPSAKLISIFRDPRDIISSYISRNYTPKTPVEAAYYYRDIMNRWEKIREGLPGGSYMEVSLERMIETPEETSRQICRFLDIPWHEKMLSVKLMKTSTQRWKRDLSKKDLKDIQPIIHRELDLYGYEMKV